jgi:hypothetical protein
VTGLKSLAIEEARRPEADAAADALFDTAGEVSWLHWLIEPANIWMQRGFALGMFSWGTWRGVSAELAERRQAKPVGVKQPGRGGGEGAGISSSPPPPHQDMAPLGAPPLQEQAA